MNTYAQNIAQLSEDSLLKALQTYKKEDTLKIRIIRQLSSTYPQNPIKVKEYAEQALSLARKIKFTKGECEILFSIGNLYFSQGIYTQAAEYFYKSLDIAERNNFTELIISNLNALGLCFRHQKQYAQAESIFLQALKKAENNPKESLKGKIIGNLGIVHGEQEKYEIERQYYQRAIQIYERTKDSIGLSTMYNNIGESFAEENKPHLALYNFEKSFKISEKINDLEGIAFAKVNTARVYFKLDKLAEAEASVLSGLNLVEKYRIFDLKDDIYEILSKVYEAKKNYELALKYQKLYNEFQAQATNEENQTKLTQLQSLYLNVQKDRENVSLKKEQAEKDNIILRQRIIFGVVSFGVLILLTLLGLLVWANRRKTKFTQVLQKQRDEISRQKAELTEINEVKDKLFSIIAHDFRGPLNSLQGVLTLVNTQELSEDEIKFLLSGLKDKLNDTQTLLENLLNWAKAQMQGIEINPTPLNLTKIVEETIRLLLPIAQKKNLHFICHIPDNLMVTADIDSLRLIMRNLLTNAAKFSYQDGTIHISSHITEGSFVQIAVKDTGIGISLDNQTKLFKTRHHFTSAGTANEKGTGLGLLLTKDFVELNGGKIWVESQENQGATFYFTLPIFNA